MSRDIGAQIRGRCVVGSTTKETHKRNKAALRSACTQEKLDRSPSILISLRIMLKVSETTSSLLYSFIGGKVCMKLLV